MTAGTFTAVKTVLVADDTAFVRDRFQAALEGAGHRAVVVRTGPEVLARMREAGTPVDLVLLDLRLPQGRGVELLRNLRKLEGQQPPGWCSAERSPAPWRSRNSAPLACRATSTSTRRSSTSCRR